MSSYLSGREGCDDYRVRTNTHKDKGTYRKCELCEWEDRKGITEKKDHKRSRPTHRGNERLKELKKKFGIKEIIKLKQIRKKVKVEEVPSTEQGIKDYIRYAEAELKRMEARGKRVHEMIEKCHEKLTVIKQGETNES